MQETTVVMEDNELVREADGGSGGRGTESIRQVLDFFSGNEAANADIPFGIEAVHHFDDFI